MNIIRTFQLDQKRRLCGLQAHGGRGGGAAMHMIFSGNPGTGKERAR